MARGLDIFGDPWGLLVLREVFFGNGRFDAMKTRLQVADSVLTRRLVSLVESGLLAKQPDDDGGRTRHEYVLTAKGEDALPVLNAVVIWSEKHLQAPSEQAHMYVVHASCGQRTSSADSCTECGERLTAENTSWHSLTRSEEPLPLATAPRQPDTTTNRVQSGEDEGTAA
jgi:DNA-binding HxlR family transcriptional regulator